MSSRQLVRAFFRDAPCSRPLLFPLAFYHAACLEGIQPNLLTQDPTSLTRLLRDQQNLLNADCICLRFDTAYLVDSSETLVNWSPSGPEIQWDSVKEKPWPPNALSNNPITVLLETITRLKIELRRQIPILAVVPGPVGICGKDCLDQPDLLTETVALIRSLSEEACKAGAEIVLLEETAKGVDIANIAEPIFNTINYYNAYSLLQADSASVGNRSDALLFPPEANLWETLDNEARMGTFIPPECFKSSENLQRFKSILESRPHPIFLAVTDDILVSHPIETNVRVFQALHNLEKK